MIIEKNVTTSLSLVTYILPERFWSVDLGIRITFTTQDFMSAKLNGT